jgi:hydroxypyruvate isomerase
MHRRAFARSLMGTAAGAAALNLAPSLFPPVEAAVATKAEPADLPFQLSVMLWTFFPDLPFEQRLAKVAEAGYKNVELVGEYNDSNWSEDDFKRATAKRDELGIRFDATAGLKSGLTNPNDRDSMLAELRQGLGYMEKLDCPAIIILSGDIVPGTSVQMQHESCIEGLKQAAKLVEGKKINGEPIRLLLETIDPEENPKYFLTSMTEGFEIIKSVNHPQVQMVYDFFHEQIAEGRLIEKLEANIQHVGLVHVADVPGRHEPGTGEINYQNIFRKLAQLKYERVVAMEFISTSDPVGKLREAAAMARRAAL